MPARFALPAALVLLLQLADPAPAAAANYFAGIANDVADAMPGDLICDVDLDLEGEQCSLRAAIQTANEDPGADLVELGNAVYTLSIRGAGEGGAATGDLDVFSPIEVSSLITGGTDTTFVDGKRSKDRVFDVLPGGSLTLRRFTVQNGRSPKVDSGGLLPAESGGCIRSQGTLQLNGMFLYRCSSSGDGGCVSVIDGSASLNSTLLSTCRAKGEGGGLLVAAPASAALARVTAGACRAETGGGIATYSPATTIRNATIDGNQAELGGGIAVLGAGALTLENSTISSNDPVNLDASGASGAINVSSSIVWGAEETDCLGTLVSAGGNLEGATSCGFTFAAGNDQQSQDPLLLPLNFYDGLVPTRQLSAGSPAIDHGLDVGDLAAICADTDARIRARVLGSDTTVGPAIVDSGSFEFNGSSGHPLLFRSTPVTCARVGDAYSYAAFAPREPCSDYSLTQAPSGMTIDAQSGLISWTPVAGQEGPEDVRVHVAEDGLIIPSGDQRFRIQVRSAAASPCPPPLP